MSDIHHQLSYVAWLSLPVETRAKIAALFGMQRTGESVVRFGAMVEGRVTAEQTSDGYTPQDLAVISLERMQEITGSKSDNFYGLFGELVKDIDEYVEGDEVSSAFEEADLADAMGTTTKVERKIKTNGGKHVKAKTTKED